MRNNIYVNMNTQTAVPSGQVRFAPLRLFVLRSFLVCLSFVVALTCVPREADAALTVKEVFSTPTTGTNFVVPAGITSVTVKAWGGGGATGANVYGHTNPAGGGGGFSQATLSVTPGESLVIRVGGGGAGPTTGSFPGGGGGGYSAAFRSSTPLIIAGGGGGGGGAGAAGAGRAGGAGGGTTGGSGGAATTAATGGTQAAGGTGGTGGSGSNGENGEVDGRYEGGDGGTAGGVTSGGVNGGGAGGGNSAASFGAGGGGGGYYGGGGGGYSSGSGIMGGGGGGSNYVTAAGNTATTSTQASGATAANSGDGDYVSGKGSGGASNTATVGNSGGDGLVVISYTVNNDFRISGTLYRNDGINAVGAGTTISAKVGNKVLTSTTTRSGGAWSIDVFGATSTTPVVVYVNGSSTLKATAFLSLHASSSVSNVPLYKDTLITMGTTTSSTIDLSKLTFYDFEDDTDVLYHAPRNSTTTVFGNFRVATGTTRAPASLYLEGGFTNNGTFNHNNGIVTVAGKDVNTGFDLNTTVYDSPLIVSGQVSTLTDLTFSADGTKLYAVGYSSQAIFEYALASAFDISTATYMRSFSVTTQETQPLSVTFKPDGTKMYVLGSAGDDVNEYTLSTAWNISTAVYSQLFSVATEETDPNGVTFNIDGTKMYVVGTIGDDVNEYTLSTPWNISTAAYSQVFSVAGQETTPRSVVFSNDGTVMFIVGFNNIVYRYTLATPFSVTSATYNSSFSVAAQTSSQTEGVAISADGTKMFVASQTTGGIYKYILQAPFSLATAYDSLYSVAGQDASVTGVTFSTDGRKMFVLGVTGDNVYQYTLSTAFDVSSASYVSAFSIATNETDAQAISFNPSGTKMFVVGPTGGGVDEYTLSTAFDVSTASYVGQFLVTSQDTSPQGLAFNTDGTKMYIAGRTNRTVYEYTLSTGFLISTASYSSNSFSLAGQITTTVEGMTMNADGTKMFVLEGDTDNVLEYTLRTPFAVSSATYVDSFSDTTNNTDPDGVAFNTDGTKMFITRKTGDAVLEYTLPANVTGASATLSGALRGTSALGKLALAREGTKTFSSNASTTSFHNKDVASDVVLPSKLTVKGDYRNGGLVNANNGTVHFTGTTSQAISGNLEYENRFATALFSGAGVKTFSSDAHVIDMTINSGATVVAPPELTVLDDYSNSGTFTAGAGVVKFASSSAQSIAGTLTGTSAFNDVELGDTSFKHDAVTWTARTAAQANIWNAVAYGNGLFVAVSENGTNRVMTSPDGITWTARTAAEANSWFSITYANGLFVAVAYSGTNRVMTSPDGITWTARTAAEANNWLSVTYGNGLFVAVAQTGTNRVMTSPDGITWTARSASEANSWNSVTYGNGFFVAVSGGGTNRVMTSPDGITWTARAAAEANIWTSVTYGNGLFVAVSRSGTNRVMTSPDGITWTARAAAEANSWYYVTYSNGLFVAVSGFGTNRVMTSQDGITWTARSASEANSWYSVTYGNGLFVAVSGSGTNRVMTSSSGYTPSSPTITFSNNASSSEMTIDTSTNVVAPSKLTVNGDYENNGTFTAGSGTVFLSKGSAEAEGNMTGTSAFTNVVVNSASDNTWTARTAASSNNWYGVTYGNGLFVAVAQTGTGNRVMTSPDGITWTARTSAADNNWYGITYGNGLFVAVALSGTGNRVMTSPDGITWTARTSVADNLWFSVTYGNGLFVAVSADGTNRVMTSPDGITWTARTAAEASSWYAITYGNGLFVAVAGSGTNRVMTSPDGITWTARAASEANAWNSVTYGNGLFVAVAGSGTNRVMTSPDGITWTARTAAEANTWYSVTYGNGLFAAVAPNRVMTSTADNSIFTFGSNASTTDLTVTNGSTMEAPTLLTVSSDLTNSGTFDAGTGTTTFTGSSAQIISGTLTGASSFANLRFIGAGTKTFSNNASSSNFLIESGATVVAPSKLTVNGDYENNGTFTAGSGTVFLSKGSAGAEGNMTGTSAFTNVVVNSASDNTWTVRTAAEANYWQGATYGNGLFVALSTSGTNRVMTSPDGITWTARAATEANAWEKVAYGNGIFVAISTNGTNRVMTSPDGITWTARSATQANTWNGLTYGEGLFVAVSGDGANRVMTSPDGITWTARAAAEANWWTNVTYGNGQFVAVALSGTNRVMTSPDGITWTARAAAEANQWYGITYGNGLFVATSDTGTNRVMTSPDGITWTARAAAEANGWYDVTYGNGLFVAVSQGGTNRVMTSPDGITWTAHTAAEANAWDMVVFGQGKFVAIANSGTNRVMTSTIDNSIVTFGSNASTTGFTIGSGASVYGPSKLSIAGDYSNSGTFEAGTGTTTFNGTTNQTATGTMTGTSAFYNLHIANTAATTTFGNDFTADVRLSSVAGTSIIFPSSATSTFATIKLDGTSGNEIVLRSLNSGVQWKINTAAQQSVTYVNVKDSTACGPGIDITASNSTDAGNNTCWNITSAPVLTSFANQVFRVGQATTTMESITITTGAGGSAITAANDIRIAIATTSTAMKFDTTDTTAIFGGTASAKVTNPVSYERNGTVLVIPVSNDFTSGDTLTISGLSFAQFTTLSAPANSLGIRTGGAADLVNEQNDSRTVAISGTFTVANHDSGQVTNLFSFQNQTAQPFYAFKITPTTESFTVSSLVLSLAGIKGIDGTNISNFALYRDKDNSKTFTAGDVAIGGSGTLSITGQTGTITFASSFSATTSQNYIVTANTNAIKPNESVMVNLNVAGLVTGQTSLATVVPVGAVNSIQHIRGGGAAGGSIGGDAPAGQGIVGGGGGGGGEEIGTEPGFQIPTANGTPFNEWTAGGSGYASDGAYATAASANLRQSYSVFGFSVPTGNTVTGIEVKLEASGSTAAGTIEVALSWNGDSSITATKQTATLGTSDVVYTLGGPSDLWGRSWTPAELGNANFFVRVIGQPSGNTVRVDAIQVKPHHILGGGGGGGGGAI